VKIAMVSEHASPLATLGGVDAGGQNVHVAALAAALAERGHHVVVYTRRDSERLPRRVSCGPGVEVEHISAGPPEPVNKDALLPHMDAFAVQLYRRWRLDPPDVAHAHFWMSGLAALRAAVPLDVPVVQTFHALGSVKRRWQAKADTSPAERIGTERRLALSVNKVIATCADEVAELKLMGATESTIDVVPCGVDPTMFTPTGPHRPRRRIVALSRLVPRKGIDDIILALPYVPDAELIISGGPAAHDLDTDAEVLRLRSLTSACRVADRVAIGGRVARRDVPALLRSADVVATVPWYEPFGIVPLEAMASGVPVVASAVGGHLDTVVDGTTGLLVSPRAPMEQAAALRKLLDNPAKCRAMGRAARSRVTERFGWTTVAAQTESTYRAVLASRLAPNATVEVSS
jgi:D-inositol-3-phosphate glycosyltransferase